jgi:mRNA-degrading endonuclease RelE of RelBE toxin-antitoxin system
VNVRLSPQFERSYANAPFQIQKLFDRKLALLVQNLRHPSLRAKKYDEARDIWQARVDRAWRFYFQIRNDTYYLLNITPHPK